MSEVPCSLVIEHQKILGSIAADLCHIKKKVDNGLTEKLDDVCHALEEAKTTAAIVKADLDAKTLAIDNKIAIIHEKSWLPRLLTIGVKQLILYGIGIIIVSAFLNTGIAGVIRWQRTLDR